MSDTPKTALITGASSGIGFELCRQFAMHGFNLVMVSQNAEKLAKAADGIRSEFKIEPVVLAKDLSQAQAPREIFDHLASAGVTVDVLVNNAGIQVYGPFAETKLEDNLKLIAINLVALTALTNLYLKEMVKRGSGKILNVASTGAFQPVPLNSVYCATKSYVLNFSYAIAEELKGTGVTVTALCPGPTKTDFARRAGIEDIRLFKRAMDAGVVAEEGFKALMKGKRLCVPGLFNKLLAFSVRFAPRDEVTKSGMHLMSR